MVHSLTAFLLLLVALICIPKATEAIRTKLFEISDGQNRTKDVDFCKSIVVSQGYTCEHHEVRNCDAKKNIKLAINLVHYQFIYFFYVFVTY